MSKESSPLEFPELFIGLAGPIGIDTDALTKTIQSALKEVDYSTQLIRVTEEVDGWASGIERPAETDFYSVTTFKMDHANALCRKFTDPAALIRVVLQSIKERRQSLVAALDENATGSLGQSGSQLSEDAERAVPKTAYIIRQLKRPEEVELLRRVYGKQFILISAYAGRDERKAALEKRIRGDLKISVEDKEVSFKADDLIFRDSLEGQDDFGQHMRDTFHLADFFVDGINASRMSSGVERFVKALFGRNDISPTRAEYGMYAAKAASLRSLDLSRQIGAAIFSPDGELVTQGCNEVPRAFGGTYWDQEEPDFRDIKLGADPNDQLKKDMLRDLLERLNDGGFLSDEASQLGSSQQLVDALIYPPSTEISAGDQPTLKLGCLKDAAVMEVTEYGRVVHAEMSAICDAARLGKPIKGSTLYTTTFPCHNCTKHIISSGVHRVIFMEPYPKSKAKVLHEHEIDIEEETNDRVAFVPFLGISPVKYRDIFQKTKSRKSKGKAREWYFGYPRPMLDVSGPAYLDNEAFEYKRLGADIVIDAAEAEGEPGEAEDAAAAEAESETLDDTAATDAKQDDVAEDKGDVK